MNTLATFALLMPLTVGFGGRPAGGSCPVPCQPPAVPAATGVLVQPPCPPLGPPAQILAVKFVLPEHARVTAFPGTARAVAVNAGEILGLRPGYIYRFELAGVFAGQPSSLYPEIEVRGTLVPRPGMNVLEYYVGLAFSQRDLDRAAAGNLITKVYYLEDPELAVPAASSADQPLEVPEDDEPAAVRAAHRHGRVVAIVRLGNRRPSDEELARRAVDGTLLLPGQQHLGQPAMPPIIGWHGVPLYDPLLGPKFPHEECFTDGGDTGPRLGIRDDRQLGGLSPTDTAAEFSINDKRRVVTSNTVCICAPRFVARRVETGLNGFAAASRADSLRQTEVPGVLRARTPPLVLAARIKPQGLLAMVRPMVQAGVQRLDIAASQQGLRAIYSVQGVQQAVALIEPRELQNADEFLLLKEVEPAEGVKVGDAVTITLRYSNRTGKPVDDVVVSDSLSGRLEYIPGTTKSDRPVNVTLIPNEAGSAVVRFELPGTLQPGQGGVIQFRAKVR